MEQCFELLNKYKTSNYTRQCLKELAPLFSKRFGLSIDKMYNDKSNLVFFVKLIKDKKQFDIEQIKLDIINGVDLENLAVEYREPIYVIKEIKDNIETLNYNIVSTKIYNRPELEVIFNGRLDISTVRIKLLDEISYKPYRNHKSNLLWLGKDIIDNYNKLIATFLENRDTIQNNNKLIKLTTVSEALNIPYLMLHRYIKEKIPLFDVMLTGVTCELGTIMYLKEEEVELIKNNLKFYIKTEEMTKQINSKDVLSLTTLFINTITDRTVNVKNKYIKKEDAIYFLKLSKIANGNLKDYRKFLAENIKVSVYKEFKLKVILKLIYKTYYKIHYEKQRAIYDDILTKEQALNLVKSIKSINIK